MSSFRAAVPLGGLWWTNVRSFLPSPDRGVTFSAQFYLLAGSAPITLRAHNRTTGDVVDSQTLSATEAWTPLSVTMPREDAYGWRDEWFTIVSTGAVEDTVFYFDEPQFRQYGVPDDTVPGLSIPIDLVATPVVLGPVGTSGSISLDLELTHVTLPVEMLTSGSLDIPIDMVLYQLPANGSLDIPFDMTLDGYVVYANSGDMTIDVDLAAHARKLTTLPAPPAPAPPEALGVFPMPTAGGTTIRATMGKTVVMDTPTITDGVPSS